MVKVKAIILKNDGSIDTHRSMFALTVTGKSGPSSGFGFSRFGACKLGNSNRLGGIYQKRVTGYNRYGRSPTRPRRSYYVKMRTYRPTNPRTPAQQAQRAKMALAWEAWRELDPVEKSRYNSRGKRAGRAGQHLFISWYLKNH